MANFHHKNTKRICTQEGLYFPRMSIFVALHFGCEVHVHACIIGEHRKFQGKVH